MRVNSSYSTVFLLLHLLNGFAGRVGAFGDYGGRRCSEDGNAVRYVKLERVPVERRKTRKLFN